jgi:hypothetical protein
MEIIDNFLPRDIFLSIQKMFFREDFPWYWLSQKTAPNEKYGDKCLVLCDDLDNHQFTHDFYNSRMRISNWNIEPILDLLGVRSIIRVKANLTVKTDKIITYGFHTDSNYSNYEPYDSKVAIFYVNSNNGKTIFENGDEVESIENRVVIFDNKLKHTGTSCTNQKRRIVLNINYF